MTDANMKHASLAEIRKLRDAGKLFRDPGAPEGEPLGADFWAKAKLEEPKRPRSVHLKLDPEVFEFFFTVTGGKGHLSRMQAVLKAYAVAHRDDRSTKAPQ